MADVDHFKKVNDGLGHDSGDSVLKIVAHCLTGSLRAYDGVGRYGGEEFLMVLPGCNLEVLTRRANEIREFVARTPIPTAAGAVSVTLSMGVMVAESSSDFDTLIRHADAAMYQAKRTGRNRVERSAVMPATVEHA